MTYKEAKQVIEDNERLLNEYETHSNPPHWILGKIIAPESSNLNREEFILHEIKENHKSNEDVLLELNLFSQDLIPYIALRIWGHNLIIPLRVYLEWPAVAEREKPHS